MVYKTVAALLGSYRNSLVRERFYWIAHLQIVLAGTRALWELPRRHAINQKRIIEDLGNFMAQGGHVLNAGLGSKIPGEIQLAKTVTQIGSGSAVGSKMKVWNPSTGN